MSEFLYWVFKKCTTFLCLRVYLCAHLAQHICGSQKTDNSFHYVVTETELSRHPMSHLSALSLIGFHVLQAGLRLSIELRRILNF